MQLAGGLIYIDSRGVAVLSLAQLNTFDALPPCIWETLNPMSPPAANLSIHHRMIILPLEEKNIPHHGNTLTSIHAIHLVANTNTSFVHRHILHDSPYPYIHNEALK